MSRHLVKEGNTIGWKENPTDEDYVLTYERPIRVRWRRGFGERELLTKDGELVGWRNIIIKETFPGEVMTRHTVSSGMVEYDWGNLPTGDDPEVGLTVGVMEGFTSTTVWNPSLETLVSLYNQDGGQIYAKFGVDVNLVVFFMGPYSKIIYEGDVPAGTEVKVTGYVMDNLVQIGVVNPQSNEFSYNQFDEGVVVITATKL